MITNVEKGKADLTNCFLLRGTEEAKHFEDESIEVV